MSTQQLGDGQLNPLRRKTGSDDDDDMLNEPGVLSKYSHVNIVVIFNGELLRSPDGLMDGWEYVSKFLFCVVDNFTISQALAG